MFTGGYDFLFATRGTFCSESGPFDLLFRKGFDQLSDGSIDVKRAHAVEWNAKELTALWAPAPSTVILGQAFQAASTE
jgi:hypothetical protein